MSNADAEEIVRVSSEGISVEKSFEPDDFPVPAIAFNITSDRDETVSIRLIDSVPDDVAAEDIGFHPKYGAEFWDVEDGMIVFERDFDPNEEYTTVYGLRGGDAEAAEKFLTEPELESVDPPMESEESGDVVRDVIDDSEDEDEGDLDDIESAVTEVETDEPQSHEDDHEPVDSPSSDDVELAVEPEKSVPTPTTEAGETLASRLASEIRAGDVDDDELATLRDALGVETATTSVETRIEHLQSEVADLTAYTNALEEFLDENGDAERINELQAEFESATERLEEVEEISNDAAETASSVDERLEDRLDEFETRIDEAIESEIASLREEIEEMEAGLDDEMEERIEELEDEIEELSEELEDVAEMRDRLASALGGLAPDSDDDS